MAAGGDAARTTRTTISVALIGSCTNSSYEDICARRRRRAAGQARTACSGPPCRSMVTPGLGAGPRDDRARRADGRAGGGSAPPCWPTPAARASASGSATRSSRATRNTIVTSFNRNFPRRNDGNPETLAFIGSPEIVAAYAVAGRLSFNPLTDAMTAAGRHDVQARAARSRRRTCPPSGFVRDDRGLRRAAGGRQRGRDPDRPRRASGCSCSSPFAAWDGKDFERAAAAAQGQGQVHDRPHLAGRPLAALPRPPRQHLGQHVHRRDQRLHRRGRARRATCSTRRAGPAGPRGGAGLQGRRAALGRRRRRELRRGLEPRARRDVAAPARAPRR